MVSVAKAPRLKAKKKKKNVAHRWEEDGWIKKENVCVIELLAREQEWAAEKIWPMRTICRPSNFEVFYIHNRRV